MLDNVESGILKENYIVDKYSIMSDGEKRPLDKDIKSVNNVKRPKVVVLEKYEDNSLSSIGEFDDDLNDE